MVVGLAGLTPEVDNTQVEATTPRPWSRYLARIIDEALFDTVLVCSSVLLPLPWTPLQLPWIFGGSVMLLMWVFFEALLLSTWGTTPGKALLRVVVRNQDGSKLSYKQALSRAVRVWIQGEGLCLPFVCLLTEFLSYGALTRLGRTAWDAAGNYRVETEKPRVFRIVLAITVIVTLVLCMLITQLGPTFASYATP